jgi:hypothetical protein
MPLPTNWATPEDFATLFQYFWHKDFPIDPLSPGAKRTDWTIHIGIIVRSIADLIGLVARFEAGSRKDAVLRSKEGDEIAIEWEWQGVWGNELEKLRTHKGWSPIKGITKPLKYGVLISYAHTSNINKDCKHIEEQWGTAPWPLLLILVDTEKTKKYRSGREFKNIQMFIFDKDGYRKIREAPAIPWHVERTRWFIE